MYHRFMVGNSVRQLSERLRAYAPHDGSFPLPLPGSRAVRQSKLSPEPIHATLGPALCVAAQGAKAIMLGSEIWEYDASRVLVFSVGLPISAQVIRASPANPYLGFVLELNPHRIAEVASRVFPRGVPKAAVGRGLVVTRPTGALFDAVSRLIDVTTHNDEADLLAPLMVDEILIRLLRSPIGIQIAQMGRPKSGVHQVAQAVAWIRTHFDQPIQIEEIAASAHMSASALHKWFRAVTSMSPIQYQKALRLHEARRLMLFHDADAGAACGRVGYLSPSQFSREYARFFGNPPTRDVARLRARGFDSGTERTA